MAGKKTPYKFQIVDRCGNEILSFAILRKMFEQQDPVKLVVFRFRRHGIPEREFTITARITSVELGPTKPTTSIHVLTTGILSDKFNNGEYKLNVNTANSTGLLPEDIWNTRKDRPRDVTLRSASEMPPPIPMRSNRFPTSFN